MFGFLKKKPALAKPSILAPVVLPESCAKSHEHCSSGINQYIHWITEVYGYLLEEIPPVIHRANAVVNYLDCLSEKGHGRYVAGVANGEFNPDLTADTLAQLGAAELHAIHADAVHWLKTHAVDVAPEMYVVKSDALNALDKQSTGPLRSAALKKVVNLISQDRSVFLVPDGGSFKDERERIVNAHPTRDFIRVRQLEKMLSDPVVAGFRLAVGWRTLKRDNALVQISTVRPGSRNHHPSNPNGTVYMVESNLASLLGYEDRLGFHLAVSARKPGEPPINALIPGDVMFTASHEQVKDAIRWAKEDDIAFLAVALLNGYGLGKEISYLAFERETKLDGLRISAGRVYRLVAAKDSSTWLAIVGGGVAMLAEPEMQSTNIVFGLTQAQIEKIRQDSRILH